MCPGRDLGTNPPMAVTKVRFVRCFWRWDGHHPDKSGFIGFDYKRTWVRVPDSDDIRFNMVMKQYDWKNFNIYVRGL